MPTEKYGVVPDAVQCPDCDGADNNCPTCGGTGRTTGKVDPVKEGEMMDDSSESAAGKKKP